MMTALNNVEPGHQANVFALENRNFYKPLIIKEKEER